MIVEYNLHLELLLFVGSEVAFSASLVWVTVALVARRWGILRPVLAVQWAHMRSVINPFYLFLLLLVHGLHFQTGTLRSCLSITRRVVKVVLPMVFEHAPARIDHFLLLLRTVERLLFL